MSPQKIVENYCCNAKKRNDVPKEFPTLKKYKEFRKTFGGLIEDSFLHNDTIKLIVLEKNENKLLKFLGIQKNKTTIKYSVYTTVEYAKKCSRWGDYSPNSVLKIDRIRQFENITIIINKHDELLNYGSSADIKLSTIYHERTNKYFDSTITEQCVKYKGKVYTFNNIINIGKQEYHYYPKNAVENVSVRLSNKKAYELLKEKIEIKRKNRQKSEKERKKHGPLLVKNKLYNQFGWCSFGVDDFCETLGLSEKSIRTSQLLQEWKKADKETKKILRSKYHEEIVEMLKYCRSTTSKQFS